MANTVIIIDEQKFSNLIHKIDKISEKLEHLNLKSNDGFKEKWYVTDEVCKILDVGRRTLQNIRDNQAIRFSKTGKKIYYKASDIEAYLEKI